MPDKRLRVALDSSYLIALLCEWHVHHQRTSGSYQRLSDRGTAFILPAHVLLECYSVLTRIPPPNRLPPNLAKELLEQNFSGMTVAGVNVKLAWNAIDSLCSLGLGGGRVYDAVIAHAAAEAGAQVLLTWNAKHFTLLAPPGLQVREP